jgi:hypothetical protein
MNDPDPISPLSDLLFERMVDGALSAQELRVAIKAIERQPDGWKRCATAFLEAQVLTESLRALSQSQHEDSAPPLPPFASCPATSLASPCGGGGDDHRIVRSGMDRSWSAAESFRRGVARR